MTTDNKEPFNLLVGKILRMLADACPAQVELDAAALDFKTGSYYTPNGITGGFYQASPEEQFLAETLRWLIAEGYVRAGTSTDYYVATLQTLNLYGSVPNALT